MAGIMPLDSFKKAKVKVEDEIIYKLKLESLRDIYMDA